MMVQQLGHGFERHFAEIARRSAVNQPSNSGAATWKPSSNFATIECDRLFQTFDSWRYNQTPKTVVSVVNAVGSKLMVSS